jgi:putative tricarboxylic transport membrane protein
MHPPPRARLPGELIFTLLLLLGSLFLLWQAYGISKFESITSAGVFPMLAALTMAVTAAVALRRTARAPRTEARDGEALPQQFLRRLTPVELLTFTASMAAYMLLLDVLGFLIASYLFLVVSMRLLGSRRWGLNLLVSAVCLGAIYLIFQTVFSVVLPAGTLLQGWKS